MGTSNISILLVEDDEVDVMNIKRAFQKNNLSNPLETAENGLVALAMLRGDGVKKLDPRPKIILLDLNMPKMNGIEFLKILRSDNELKTISVVILTTSNDEKDIVDAYDLNVAGYILKPVEFSKFVEAMRTLNLYWSLMEHP